MAAIGENRGEIAVGGGQVWRYQGRADEVLTITVRADNPAQRGGDTTRVPDGFDTILYVYGPDGVLLGEFDDMETGITDSRAVSLRLPTNGEYEFVVRSWDDRSGGAYTLHIESVVVATPSPSPSPSPTATRES